MRRVMILCLMAVSVAAAVSGCGQNGPTAPTMTQFGPSSPVSAPEHNAFSAFPAEQAMTLPTPTSVESPSLATNSTEYRTTDPTPWQREYWIVLFVSAAGDTVWGPAPAPPPPPTRPPHDEKETTWGRIKQLYTD